MKFWKLLFRFHEGAPMAKFDFKGGVSADAKVSGVSQNTPARIGGPTGPNTFPPPPPPPPIGPPLAPVFNAKTFTVTTATFPRPVTYTGVLPLWFSGGGPGARHVTQVDVISDTVFDIHWSNSVGEGAQIGFVYPDPAFVASDGGPAVGDTAIVGPAL